MQPTLIQHPGYNPKPQKVWSWSYSKLKNFRTCPRRHNEIDNLKNFKDNTEALDYGNLVHSMLANYISKGVAFPQVHQKDLQYYGDMGRAIQGDQVLCEQKMAITDQGIPVTYFDPQAWYRSVADVLGIKGPVAISLDWKTGQIVDDSEQLMLSACCIFAHFPEIQAVRTEFVWLKYRCSTRVDVTRADIPRIWEAVLPQVGMLKHAFDTNTFPPKEGGLCRKHCAVSSCEFHGSNR